MSVSPMPLPRYVYSCKCSHVFHSDANTRAKCPACGARTRTHVPACINPVDPRDTLNHVQDALVVIAGRARDGTASDIDVAMARIFSDAMKYLVPALEASLVEKRDTKAELLKILELIGDDDLPPEIHA